MVTKPILGVDVDLTICPSDIGWANYLKYFNGFGKIVHRTDGMVEYDLSKMYPTVADPYEYWRSLDYDQFKPLDGSVEALEALSKYFDIAFISQAKGFHHKSKYYWLDHHFPFKAGVILTKEKWLMKGSVVAMIDDRLDHLQGFDFDQRIYFNTNYTQSVECSVPYQFSEWNSKVVERLCGMYL
ncbi:5' nucleotidase [Pseudomonas phage vB_PsaM_M1]|nr:5' nucleotidase [Pseudomonas phage vB_PsaM_M1]